MTDPWLGLARASVTDVRRVLADLPTRAERELVLRRGEGGDDTTAIDAAAEAAIVARLEALTEGSRSSPKSSASARSGRAGRGAWWSTRSTGP